MPKEFTDCVKVGGRVRTVKPSEGTHMPVCFDEDGSHAGEVKKTRGYARGGRVIRDYQMRFKSHIPDECK
jgi:putative hemolysin